MGKFIFYTSLIIFPFGQLLKFGIINLIDILTTLIFIYTAFLLIKKKYKVTFWFKDYLAIVIYLFLGLLLNLYLNFNFFDNLLEIGLPFLYLFRLVVYGFVGVFIANEIKDQAKTYVFKFLLSIIGFTAVFGFIQYFLYPDLRPLFFWGWDDHLMRMAGTHLDPNYLSVIILIGLVLSIHFKKNILTTFFLIGVALTYSRTAILTLLLYLSVKRKILFIFILLITVALSPKMIGEGTNLARYSTVSYRFENYIQGVGLFLKSPLVGYGFNNTCKMKEISSTSHFDKNSNSCFGFDSSILLILASGGVLGFFLFIKFIHKIYTHLDLVTKEIFIILLITSFSINALFYNFILFIVFILLGRLGGKVKV